MSRFLICICGLLKGGVQQRRANVDAQRLVPHAVASKQGKYLIKEWAWGHMAPQKVRRIAENELEDIKQITASLSASGVVFPKLLEMEALAGIGSKGEHSQHMNHQLMAITNLTKIVPSTTSLPVKKIGSVFATQKDISILWPHMLFATMYNSFKEAWSVRVCPSKDELEKFWDSQSNHPNLVNHPMTEIPGWKRKAIPIAIHGDKVPVTGVGKSWCKSMYILSWCSMLGRGSTLEMNFLILALMAALFTASGTTKAQLWRGLHWSLKQLQNGKWADHDEYGQQYPRGSAEAKRANQNLCGEDGFFGTLWGLKQDLEHLVDEFLFRDYRRLESGPCSFCPCNAGDTPWKDFRLGTSVWIDRAYTIAQWIAAHPRLHIIFDLAGTSLFTVILDLLHVKYLGTDMYFNGSVLWLLCYKVLPGTAENNLSIVWRDIERYYVADPSPERYNGMKLNMFIDPSSPNVKSPSLKGKGAEVRALTPALHAVWSKYMDAGNKQHKEIKLALACSVRVDRIMDEQKGEYALPDAAAREWKSMVFTFLVMQNALGKWHAKNKMLLFNITMKSHYFAHMGLNAHHINPRLGYCFQGEDYMAKIKAITAASARGNNVYQVSGKTTAKYCRGLQLVFEDGCA